MDVDGAMGIHLQEEIIMEILSRLPVRSLLRFKCVPKFWRTLISEPYFMMKHLKNSRNSEKLLVSQWYPHKKEFSLSCSSLSSVQRVEEVQKLDCPSDSRCVLYCCYDSLELIGVSNYSNYAYERLFLWNPSTRELIVLPHPKLKLDWDLWIWGLGYDSTSDDYKILKITDRSHTEVLALKSGS
ncbi:putative F-box protein At3g16210 [Solanum dulcamara]|uniref:putative F-box protein At3g16210 n=1 Tax=Solanum dulcamara TaxID=45834 RepID=UPI0024863B50|nr:putative F-box protein At3g16210 [Solanum dulcamara]